MLAVAAKKGDDVKDFVAALGAKPACKYVESVNALRETLRAEKDGTRHFKGGGSENSTSASGGGVDS